MGTTEVKNTSQPGTAVTEQPASGVDDARKRLLSARQNPPLLALFAVVALVVGAGAILAVGILGNRGAHTVTPSVGNNPSGVVDGKGPFVVGNSVRTSFGIVAVQYVFVVSNVSAPSGSTPIEVGLAISNLSGAPTTVEASQFEVIVDGNTAKPIPILLSAPHPQFGQMLATVARTGGARFIVPSSASTLELRFHDAGGDKRTIVIELGKLRQLQKVPIEGGI